MKNYVKMGLVFGAAICTVAIFNRPPRGLEGTVKEEFGTASQISPMDNISTNKSVNTKDVTYGLVLMTSKGDYAIEVKDHRFKPILPLAKQIEIGDRVRIRYGIYTQISRDGVGTTHSNAVDILEKVKR